MSVLSLLHLPVGWVVRGGGSVGGIHATRSAPAVLLLVPATVLLLLLMVAVSGSGGLLLHLVEVVRLLLHVHGTREVAVVVVAHLRGRDLHVVEVAAAPVLLLRVLLLLLLLLVWSIGPSV